MKKAEIASQKHWVAGVFDADGSATLTGTHQPMLSFYSSNYDKLMLIQEFLTEWACHSGVNIS